MLLLHVLLSFLFFTSCTATGGTNRRPKFEFTLGQIYWFKLQYWGAKGPAAKNPYTVIPVGKVPPEVTGHVGHDLVFFAEMGENLPLEDQYKSQAKSYFDESKGLTMETARTTTNLEQNWINTGWARIASRKAMEGFHHMGKGQDAIMKETEMKVISENMLKNLNERLGSGSLKLDFNAPDLGQTFKPFIQFGYMYWLLPSYLSPSTNSLHPVVALGRMEDPIYPGHDLIFVSQLSNLIPNLDDKYKGQALKYFSQHETAPQHFLKTNDHFRELNIGYAQVTESVAFCFKRAGSYPGPNGQVHFLHMDQKTVGELFRIMQKNWKERSPTLKFELQDLGQYDPAAAPSGENIKLEKGFLYWTLPNSVRGRTLVVPIGEVPNSPNDFFVAELTSAKDFLSEQHWKSAIDYFPEGPKLLVSIYSGGKIDLGKWMVNVNWATTAPKYTLGRHRHRVGQDVQMYENKINDIFNSMIKNYEERRAIDKETDFTQRPAVIPTKGGKSGKKRGGGNAGASGSKSST